MRDLLFGWTRVYVLLCSAILLAFATVQPSFGDEKSDNGSVAKSNEPATAVFAGGCFWCVESDFEHLPGVVEVVSGYTGGRTKNPTYQNYKLGHHREAVMVAYDPKKITYAGLVEFLIKHIDPTDRTGSFIDRGTNYSSAIYFASDEEKKQAKVVIDAINEWKVFRKPFSIDLIERKPFWPAENYHQNYAKNSPNDYASYRATCGRDPFIAKVWGPRANRLELPGSLPGTEKESVAESDDGEKAKRPWEEFKKPPVAELKKKLTTMQFKVTQGSFTETAFSNRFWNHHEPGIYVDVVSGEPLFSSLDKFDSGTGWPSFVAPLVPEYITTHEDYTEGALRIEVRSKFADSHLGHVFDDGPPARGGMRFCINSACLRFIPVKDLEKEGYGEFLERFKKK